MRDDAETYYLLFLLRFQKKKQNFLGCIIKRFRIYTLYKTINYARSRIKREICITKKDLVILLINNLKIFRYRKF